MRATNRLNQIEKYPERTKSIVDHGKSERKKVKALSDREWQMKHRTGMATQREVVIRMLKSCYKKAISKRDFLERVKECGLKIYSRRGVVAGMLFCNRKFRFKRIGFMPERLEELEVRVKRESELEKVRKGKIVSRIGVER